MQFLRFISKIMLSFLALTLMSATLSAKELPAAKKHNLVEYAPTAYINTSSYIPKVQATQSEFITFNIIDSLANAYSYFTSDQQPFVYYSAKNTLITIKRGALAATATSNTLNDLYIRTSTDLGVTWDPAQLVYNSKDYSGNLARYPSIYGLEYDGKISYVFTSPITDGNGWKGFINGFYNDGLSLPTFSKTMVINGDSYGWNGTDSKITGGVLKSNDPYGLAVSIVMPPSGLPLEKTSSIGMRFSSTFDSWTASIPPQWNASVFVTPVATTRSDSLRNSSVIGLRQDGGNLYFAVYGRFLNSDDNTKFLPGVSKSTDNGTTWSSFEVFPRSVINNYATSVGVDPTALNLGNQDFHVFPNGDYSYIVGLNEDTTVTNRLWADAVHGLFELYKKGTTFGIRAIANNTGYVLSYTGSTTTNQMGDEVMVSRTVDGSALLVKWVDFVDVQDSAGTVYPRYTNDVFVAIRDANSNTWSKAKNVTQTLDYDRITWIPDYIPNNLKNVPVLKLESIPNPNDTPTDARNRQRSLETDAQYVLVGNFDADLLLGVEDNKIDNIKFDCMSVYPNPSDKTSFIDLNLPSNGNVSVDVFSVNGSLASTFNFNDVNGITTLQINTQDLTTGSYYLVINFNGNKITKLLNVIH